MFTRVPGTIRQVDVDGEDDPAIITRVPGQLLSTEAGVQLITEDGQEFKTE